MPRTKQKRRIRRIADYLRSGELSLGAANEIAAIIECLEKHSEIDTCTLEEIDRWRAKRKEKRDGHS